MQNSVENPAEGFQSAFPLMGLRTDITEPLVSSDVDDSLQHRMYMIRRADESGLNASPRDLIRRIKRNRSNGGTNTTILRYFEDDGTIGYYEVTRGDLKRYFHKKKRDGRQEKLEGL